MKYVNTGVVFQEIPDEVTLSINISACPCHCMGCHSEYLWDDIGTPLTALTLGDMLREYGADITCVCFMGGDGEPDQVNALAAWTRKHYPTLHIGWYSGRPQLSAAINLKNFDYVKLGPYVQTKGGLDHETTNQRMYRVEHDNDNAMTDITHLFWKKHTK